MRFLEQTPLWIIGLVMLVALAAVHELSAWAGRRFGPGRGQEDGRGYLVSSALGLLALMMAFSFSAAQSRFDLRQSMVGEEAVAMGTAYLRTQVVPAPWRDQLGARLLDYAEARAGFARAAEHPAELSANLEAGNRAQRALWATVDSEIEGNPTSTMNFPLVQGINAMFDAADLRLAAQERRVPLAVLRMLAFFSLGVAGVVGFAGSGGGARHYFVVSAVVLVLITLAYGMILDLDRPGSGTIRIQQGALERTIASIRQSEQAKRSAQPTASRAP